jgi:LuxR family maltose regulon positive regulatory protein
MKKGLKLPPPVNTLDLGTLPLSKITPPVQHRVFIRPRLQELLTKNEDKKLVLILGQAAQGKSTTAAAYFRTSPIPSAWINLGPEDSDPLNLYSLLGQILPRKSDDSEAVPWLSLPTRSIGPREPLFQYREWIIHLFKNVTLPWQIFLDGLDHLHPQAESFRFLQVLIGEMPPATRLILLSRSYPPLHFDFQRLIMSREAVVLNNDVLAFSPREIKQLFRDIYNLALSPEQVDRIHRATDGWVGGIILLVEAMKRLSPGSPEKFLEGAWTDHYQRETFQYFGKEIFHSLTPAQQQFLLRSSALEEMEPGVVRQLFPKEDGEALLQELTRKNLFVQAFPDPNRGFVFRYHNLFRTFLTTLFRTRFSEEEQCLWHRRIGECYEQKGTAMEAIPHYLEARDYPAARDLIRREGVKSIRDGRIGELIGWLQGLPEPLVRDDPWLALFQTLPSRFFAREETIRNLEHTVYRFREQGDQSGMLLGMAYLIEAKFFLGRYRPELIREAEEIVERYPGDAFPHERAFLWCQTGIAQTLRGNTRRGYWACRNAYLFSRQLSDPLLQAVALCHGVYALAILGEFREADRLLREAGSLCWNSPQAEIRFFYALSQVAYLCFTGDAEKALPLCETLVEESENQGLSYLYPVALLHKQFALLYLQDYQQVDLLGAQITALADALEIGFLMGAAEFYSGVGAYWSQRDAEARGLIVRSLRRFEAPDSYSELHRVGARLALSLLDVDPDHRPAAILDLQEVVQYLEQIQSRLLLSECHLALALLFHAQGEAHPAKHHLQEGLNLARRRGYRHFMIISPRDTARACLLAQGYFDTGDPAAEYGTDLLLRKYGRLAGEDLEKLANHPDPRVSRTAQDVRRSNHRSAKPVLHLNTFGGLRLTFGREKMSNQAWDRIQPRRLLVAMLSQRQETISKEVLIETLWPEEQPGSGENNFKTTLQRLRKTLEAEIDPRFGSSYFHLHQNLLFFDEELCRIDCREFAALAREGATREKAGDWKGALDTYARALDLYEGDFIPEERYAPWVELRRDDYRNILIDLLTRSAQLHERSGAFKKAEACLKRVIEADPLLEEAYRSLMTLYAEKKRYNEALRVFQACQKALKEGLRTQPDPLTRALHQGIRERAGKDGRS